MDETKIISRDNRLYYPLKNGKEVWITQCPWCKVWMEEFRVCKSLKEMRDKLHEKDPRHIQALQKRFFEFYNEEDRCETNIIKHFMKKTISVLIKGLQVIQGLITK